MKTKDVVQKEINELLAKRPGGSTITEPFDPKGKKELQRDRKHIVFLKKMLVYLESSPRKEFVVSEKDVVKKRMKKITDEWAVINKEGKLSNKARNEYFKSEGLPKLKTQLKSLTYLLS